MTITELKQTAVEVRKGIVTATHAAKSGHPGGIAFGDRNFYIFIF